MTKKAIWTLCRIVGTLLAWLIGGYVLQSYEYFTSLTEIDNIVGMMPATLVVVGAGGTSILL